MEMMQNLSKFSQVRKFWMIAPLNLVLSLLRLVSIAQHFDRWKMLAQV